MAAAFLTEKVSAAGSTQRISGRGGCSQGPTGARGGGDAWVLAQGAVGAGVGSAVRARRGLAGPGPGQPRGKPSQPCQQPSLPVAGAGEQREGGAAPRGGGGAVRPEARAEAAQVPGAAPEAGA